MQVVAVQSIISYFERRTTNGMVEGINNKLKLIKRRAYGFRNFRNFWVRSMLSWHLVCLFSIKNNEEPPIFSSKLPPELTQKVARLVY